MAVRFVEGYNDPAWDEVKDRFYANFNPDDWDSITIAKTRATVKRHCKKRLVCDFEIRKVGDEWWGVNYHS